MLSLKTTLLAAALSLPLTLAHGHIRAFCVGDNCYGGYNPSYPPEFGETPIRPTDNGQGFADFYSPIIATGGMGNGDSLPSAKGNAGDRVTFTNSPWPDNHHGPIMEYMANCNGPCQGVAGSSLEWFKVHEETYNPATGRWPTQDINEANGYFYQFNLPTDLPAGNYLLRHELLALHLLENGQPSPQFYPVAFALELNSQGTTVPSPTGRFPDMYARDNMAVTHNIYVDDNSKFVPPGVPVYSAGSGTAAPITAPSAVANGASDTNSDSASPAASPSAAEQVAAVAEPSASPSKVASNTCRMRRRRRSLRA